MPRKTAYHLELEAVLEDNKKTVLTWRENADAAITSKEALDLLREDAAEFIAELTIEIQCEHSTETCTRSPARTLCLCQSNNPSCLVVELPINDGVQRHPREMYCELVAMPVIAVACVICLLFWSKQRTVRGKRKPKGWSI